MVEFFKKNQQINIGLDVGTASIKAVAIDKSKVTPELIAFSYEPLTVDRVACVKSAVTKLGISNISVNTSISGPSIIVRIIEMPHMTEKELKSAAKFESEKYIPYKIDEVITDCVKIEDTFEGKMNVLLVAAKKPVVNDRIGLLSEAGLTLRAIDIDSFAVMNAFLNSQQENADTTCALINIGAKVTNINVIRGRQSYLARDIEIAGNNITYAIAEGLNIKKEKAETAKINPGNLKNEIVTVVRGVFFNLLDEVRLSFDFYENHYGKNVQKIYLSGGSCKMDGADDLIQDMLGADAIFWNPFNNINMGPKIDTTALEPLKSSFAVAVGLGLREN